MMPRTQQQIRTFLEGLEDTLTAVLAFDDLSHDPELGALWDELRETRRQAREIKSEEAQANARLIAAAPDLLAACVDLLMQAAHVGHPDDDCECHIDTAKATAAIAKARKATT